MLIREEEKLVMQLGRRVFFVCLGSFSALTSNATLDIKKRTEMVNYILMKLWKIFEFAPYSM